MPIKLIYLNTYLLQTMLVKFRIGILGKVIPVFPHMLSRRLHTEKLHTWKVSSVELPLSMAVGIFQLPVGS